MKPPDGPQRVGIFGGSFDPPHIGHFLAVEDAVELLKLDLVLWVPVATQPLKQAGPHATGEQRLRMVELTVQGHPRFAAEASETSRGGLSFTVDTLTALRTRFPGAELFLLLGEDSWATFEKWRDPGLIRELAQIAILSRDAKPAETGKESPGTAPLMLKTRRIDVSATEIRERVRLGKPVTGFVRDAVATYIARQGLYIQ